MKVLITGGAGYLGSTLAALLISDHLEVKVFDHLDFGGESLIPFLQNPKLELISGDLRDAHLPSLLQGVDAVVHLAAVVGDPACAKNPDLAREINVGCSKKLIGAASDAGVKRFVFASTCSNYGKMRDTSELATENHELRPVSLYAETKVEVEQFLLQHTESRMTPVILRFATLYGISARMRFDLTVNEFVMRLATEKHLTVFGEQFWRPYVHVTDAARAIQAVLQAPDSTLSSKVFNVGNTNENYTKADLVQLAQKRIPDTKVEYVKKTEDPRDYRVSFDHIRNTLNFDTTRTVPDGIDELAGCLEAGVFADVANRRYYNS